MAGQLICKGIQMKTLSKASVLALMGLVAAPSAVAVPLLQLYIEGATYNSGSQTWVYSGTDPLRLWAIGNVDGEGGKGSIFDVKLSIAYADGLAPTFTLTPSTTGNYGGYADPSTPAAPTYNQTVTDGSAPLLGDGTSLPTHGIYGSGTDWQEFLLGDFTLTDSQMADFVTSFPAATGDPKGQINVYQFGVTGVAAGTVFHFDLYDHISAANDARYIFAPFSHDAGGSSGNGDIPSTGPVPEPGMASLLGIGLLGQAWLLSRRRRYLKQQ
jgi:hypothetical protein